MKANELLTIFHYNGSTYADHSMKLSDFLRDPVALAMKTTEALYIGYFKPINSFYAEMKIANTVANAIMLQYWNGTTWAALAEMVDETAGFTRSGFIQWERNLADQAKNTINTKELYWYKLTVSANHSALTEIMGLNIVFASDHDLEAEFPDILSEKYVPTGKTSHVAFHVAARNEIIQTLRNQGNVKSVEKISGNSQLNKYHYENINAWDILDLGEIRQSATMLCLSKIFYTLSDKNDDYYAGKGLFYSELYKAAFKLYVLSIDIDDDGINEDKENLAPNTIYMTR